MSRYWVAVVAVKREGLEYIIDADNEELAFEEAYERAAADAKFDGAFDELDVELVDWEQVEE